MRTRISITIFCLALFSSLLLFGCEKEATPEAEVGAAMKTKQQAKDAAAESAKQVQEGNAVLDGK